MEETEIHKKYYPTLKQSIFLNIRLIIITIIVLIPLVILMMVFEKDGESQYPIIESLIYFIGYTVPFAIICHFAIKRIKHLDFPDFKLNIARLKPLTLLVLIVMTLALIIVIEPFTYFIPMPDFFKEIMAGMVQPNIFSFLTIVIAAPILEEIFFRGIILEGLLKNYSPTKAIIWSALIFGIAHLNPWQAISATLAGIFIGWIYWKTNSLISGILIHFVNNLMGFVIITSSGSGSDSIIQLINNNLIFIILFLASLVILFWGYRLIEKNLKLQKTTN